MTVIESIAWLVVLVGAIWTGMFTRYVGQLLIDWSKQPTEDRARAKAKKERLDALKSTISNAKQYCQQIADYLSGFSKGESVSSDELREAAFEAGTAVIIPTFNLDTQVLESLAPSLFTVLDHEKAQRVMATRLELRHAQRRIDTLAEMVFLRNTTEALNASQSRYIQGTRQLINTTVENCEATALMLDNEIDSISVEPKVNKRPWLIISIIVVFLAVFVLATSYINGITINLSQKQGYQPRNRLPMDNRPPTELSLEVDEALGKSGANTKFQEAKVEAAPNGDEGKNVTDKEKL